MLREVAWISDSTNYLKKLINIIYTNKIYLLFDSLLHKKFIIKLRLI